LRVISCHRAHRVVAFWPFAALAVLLSLSACRHGVPLVDTSAKPAETDGTITGTVRGPQGTIPVDGRAVEVVNVETGQRHRTNTDDAGGFSFKLRPGTYRVDLALRDGEKLIKQPGVINVNRSDIDAHADFVLGASGVARPRYHAPRTDDGLGSAIG
jgi:hypothetical protein